MKQAAAWLQLLAIAGMTAQAAAGPADAGVSQLELPGCDTDLQVHIVDALGRRYLHTPTADAMAVVRCLDRDAEARLRLADHSLPITLTAVSNPGEIRRVDRAFRAQFGLRTHAPDRVDFWRANPVEPQPDPGPLAQVREDWLVSEEEILNWHELKDSQGPALTGNASWRHFMAFLERELRSAGVVDLERNSWTFDRWRTSPWPDDTGWSLHVAGEPVRVSSYGANSGSTGPEGHTAPLVYYDFDDPPGNIRGRIVVFRTRSSQEMADALEGQDYEYRSAPDSAPERGDEVPAVDAPQSWQIFPQLMQTPEFIRIATAGKAAGALFVFDAGSEQMAGMYTFPVPDHYDVPTLYLDRTTGATVIEQAHSGAEATLRLDAELVESEAYQLIGYLPGRDYGSPDDELVKLTTHTDGPSISQDNGALGLLGVIRYMARVPQQDRPRTLLLFLDSRHFMPGAEGVFAEHDFFEVHPELRDRVRAMVGMEHLGQVEFREEGDRLVRTGRTDTSLLWTTDNERLIDHAITAVMDNAPPATRVHNIARPGIRGGDQGTWFGMTSEAPELELPAFATMGTMGVYWAMSSGVDRLDTQLFGEQLATFVQLTGTLMTADLDALAPEPPRNHEENP